MVAIASAPRAVSTDVLDKLFRKITWKIIPLLFVGYVIAYIDRVNIGFAKLQMMDDLQFSAAAYGLGAGIFFLGFIVVEIPSNLILYRIGARAWLARIMITWGVITILMMFVKTPASFYLLRFLLGVAEAGFFPGVIYYLTLWYPENRRGRVFSVFAAGSAIGGFIVGPLSGWIMSHLNDVAHLRGWQWLFLLQGIPAILLGGLLFLRLSDGPSSAKWLSAEERAKLSEQVGAKAVAGHAHSSVWTVFQDGRVWLLGLILGAANLGIYLGVFWMPTIIRDAGFQDLQTVGFLSSIAYLIAAAAMYALGRSSDYVGDRKWHIATILVIGAIALTVSPLFHQVAFVGMSGVIIATALLIGITPLLWAHASSFIDGKIAAAGFALINVCAGVAAFLGPYIMGLSEQYLGSTDLVFYGIATACVIAAVLLVAAPTLSAGRAA
ncbi:MFS transporter [Mesorhizobium sp. IMUNJ 23232]|uniref:MFS transporter n=1 Tax=Mesorhizobium sp. IMUNJ 23232 TaxID=3376064 RepID=UPI0037AEEE2E